MAMHPDAVTAAETHVRNADTPAERQRRKALAFGILVADQPMTAEAFLACAADVSLAVLHEVLTGLMPGLGWSRFGEQDIADLLRGPPSALRTALQQVAPERLAWACHKTRLRRDPLYRSMCRARPGQTLELANGLRVAVRARAYSPSVLLTPPKGCTVRGDFGDCEGRWDLNGALQNPGAWPINSYVVRVTPFDYADPTPKSREELIRALRNDAPLTANDRKQIAAALEERPHA